MNRTQAESEYLLQAARLQLLVSQLERRPGVEHGGPQLGPNQVVAQPEDLRRKLGGSVRGEDGGAAETCSKRDGGSVTAVRVEAKNHRGGGGG